MKICSVGAELLHADGRTDKQVEFTQTDRQNAANCRISKLCKRAQNLLYLLVVVISIISRISSN